MADSLACQRSAGSREDLPEDHRDQPSLLGCHGLPIDEPGSANQIGYRAGSVRTAILAGLAVCL